MTKTTEDKRLKEVKKVIEEWDTYPRETQIALESAISMARILTMIRDNEKAGQEVRKIEEKILKICMKLFWPVLIAWIICALAKIMIDFGLIT